jgi:hypothetical protein
MRNAIDSIGTDTLRDRSLGIASLRRHSGRTFRRLRFVVLDSSYIVNNAILIIARIRHAGRDAAAADWRDDARRRARCKLIAIM